MYLSKSIYVRVWNCPKYAWISRHHPEMIPVNEDTLARFRTGDEVGDLARGLFGPFVNVTAEKEEGNLDLPKMLERTREEMAKGTPVICEAAFSYEGLYCAVDLLKKEENGWAIYEVKSTSAVEDYHIADVSYQKYVLEHCGIRVAGTYLVCIDSSYVLGPEGLDLQGFFKINDIRDRVVKEQEENVPRILEIAEEVLEGENEPAAELGNACSKCGLFGYCTRHLPSPNLFGLHGMQMRTKLKHYRNGLVTFEDLEKAGAVKNEMQKRQIDYALHERETYVNREEIRKFLGGLSYPLYFLDFETMQTAIPLYVGTHPYAQIPFQYSLHYIEREGGELRHREFLGASGQDPRREIAESLCRDIPADACVTAYHKDFECTRLKELAGYFPDLADHLLAVRDHIVDLEVPFSKGMYYTRAMDGRSSIKAVLPAICPGDPELDYHELEGVHNGSEAMSIFPLIQYMPPEEQERARKNLLAYCRLDTLAMVKVWEELKRAVSPDDPRMHILDAETG